MTAISYGRWVAALLAMIVLAACGESDPTPTPTATPTVQAVVAPTYTPTPPGAEPGQSTTAGDGDSLSIALSTPTPDPASAEPVEPTDTPVTTQVRSPDDLLESGRQFLRYGDYASAREVFATIRNDPSTESALRREAIYDLARAYVADGMYGEALTTLDSLDQELAADDADPGQFGQKEHFVRGEALAGLGRYGDAVAAYWQFLDAYPWMGEAVQPRIAVAYLALGDTDGAATAYRRAADVAGDRFTRADLLEDLAATYVDGGRYGEAVAAYDEILTFAENAGYRADVQYRAGQALAAAGDTPGAVARWFAATDEAPESGAAYLALVELVNREVDFDLYQRGYIDLQAEAYLPAINAFQAYLDAVDPTDARAGNALIGTWTVISGRRQWIRGSRPCSTG